MTWSAAASSTVFWSSFSTSSCHSPGTVARGGEKLVLDDVVCPAAPAIEDDELHEVQVVLDAAERPRLRVHSRSLSDESAPAWTTHFEARPLPTEWQEPAVAPVDRERFMASARKEIGGAEFYSYFRELGYTLGPSFRWIDKIWLDGDEALVRFASPTPLPDMEPGLEFHPGLIDSCFQSIAGFMVEEHAVEAQ